MPETKLPLHPIKAPHGGTFYCASAPGSDPFVEVGDVVYPEDVVCIVEAMKMYNNIEHDGPPGRVSQIPLKNEAHVEPDDVLMLVEPDPSLPERPKRPQMAQTPEEVIAQIEAATASIKAGLAQGREKDKNEGE